MAVPQLRIYSSFQGSSGSLPGMCTSSCLLRSQEGKLLRDMKMTLQNAESFFSFQQFFDMVFPPLFFFRKEKITYTGCIGT